MRRFFTDPENIIDGKVRIIEDASHISKVLRMEIGEEIIVFDGSGKDYVARLDEISPKECIASIVSSKISDTEPDIKVYIFQGIPKSGKMETIIQKCVELGVYKIIPVEMQRCVVKLDNKGKADKTKRWNKVSVEASKQCGRSVIPEIIEPVDYQTSLLMLKELDLAIMPYEVLGHEGRRGLKELLGEFKGKSIGVIIGPEGGFSDSEAEEAKRNNIYQIGLGKRILRTETVASSLIPIIMYEKDEI
ncbi:MAG: 16S rRNA (uracil(1498)-N(3))-methyltransferase [Clostridia bacterium]|nr:16S rRNA (uracil(1498)-N(3))-methyltransferase [Clostridia bacterium]